MNEENWKKVKDLLSEVLAFEPAKRSLVLASADVSAEVRAEVESLVAFEAEAANLMDLSAMEFSGEFLDDGERESPLVGQQIGAYEIVRELGYGGMGAVYLATRADGKFEQQVALKLLKREANTAELRRRFEQERKILASLEHPNIARLLDAGATDDGIPYFAMEYVEGLPIDDYCDDNNLGLNKRLDLFREVCSAVGFAHRNLIVHRDLKPSNILVNKDGMPKLLDFGISKIVSDELQPTATVTRLGAMTPSYASPEQLQNKSATTATDVYSLGVVLYELLSGHRPFEGQEHELKEIYRAVIETDPPSPSSIVDTVAKFGKTRSVVESEPGRENTSPNRGDTVPRLAAVDPQYLKGDLDNIVLKALKKEPERRYSSAENFAEDIRRHQEGLTVTARPDVFSYRASKFVRRNRLAVGAGLIILLVIGAGLIATLWQTRVAAAERDRARQQAQKAERINAYMQNILNFNNPHWLSSNPERNLKATVAEAMDEALKHIDSDLVNEPEIQAEILFTLAFSFNNQGQHAKADELLRRSINNFDEVYGANNLRSMQASVIVADILFMSGKYDESVAMYKAAIDYFRPKVVEDRTQSKWLAIALNDLGSIYGLQGKYDDAEVVTQESVEHVLNITGQDRYVVPILWANLGTIRGDRGDIEAGITYFNWALDEMRAGGGDERLEGAIARMNIGKIYNAKGDYRSSEKHFLEGQAILEKIVGFENVVSMFMMYHLGNSYYGQGRYDEALKQAERVLAVQHKLFPKGHLVAGYCSRLRGAVHTRTGEVKKGEAELLSALETVNKSFKEPNPEIALVKETLGENLIAQRRFDEAREMLASALDSYSKTRGDKHPFTKRCRETLAQISQ